MTVASDDVLAQPARGDGPPASVAHHDVAAAAADEQRACIVREAAEPPPLAAEHPPPVSPHHPGHPQREQHLVTSAADPQAQLPSPAPCQQALHHPAPQQPQQQPLVPPTQQPLQHPTHNVAPKQTLQIFEDAHPTQPKLPHPAPPPVIEHDDKENIPPNIWMHHALEQHMDDKHKNLKPKKLAIPLAQAGVHKKRDLSRSPLRDITAAVVGNRRSNLLSHPRSPHKKRTTLRYLR